MMFLTVKHFHEKRYAFMHVFFFLYLTYVWGCVLFCSKESLINLFAYQIDELMTWTQKARSTNDLNNMPCSFADDPYDEVGTYSDSLYVGTENGKNMLSQYPNNFSAFSVKFKNGIPNFILPRQFSPISVKTTMLSMLRVYMEFCYL